MEVYHNSTILNERQTNTRSENWSAGRKNILPKMQLKRQQVYLFKWFHLIEKKNIQKMNYRERFCKRGYNTYNESRKQYQFRYSY